MKYFYLLFCFMACATKPRPAEPPKKMPHDEPVYNERETLPRAIKITQESPVFLKPSTHSKILADVDVGTALIARNLSKTGSWIEVEDEDKRRGWVPRTRTDFFTPEKFETGEYSSDADIDAARGYEKTQAKHDALFVGGSAGLREWGAQLAYLLKILETQGRSERTLYFGPKVQLLHSWAQAGFPQGFTQHVGMQLLTREAGSFLTTGPDLYLLYRYSSKKTAMGLSYSVGILPPTQNSVYSLLRPYLEWGGGTFWGVEGQVGWVF